MLTSVCIGRVSYTIVKPHVLSSEDAKEFDEFMDKLGEKNGYTEY